MGYQIIKQPDDRYSIFNGMSDILNGLNMTRQEVIDWFVKRAEDRAKEETEQWLAEVDKGFTRGSLSFKQALRKHVAHKANCTDEDFNKEVLAEIEKHKKEK